jgi:hypothetical protein
VLQEGKIMRLRLCLRLLSVAKFTVKMKKNCKKFILLIIRQRKEVGGEARDASFGLPP